MKMPKAPELLTNLYRDLRDRRLLIPLVALVVATIAVPMVLAAGSADVGSPPQVETDPQKGALAVEPAVLAEQSGIRDYRKRLADLRRKNPFEQRFAAPTPKSIALRVSDGGAAAIETGSKATSSAPAADPSSSSSSPPAPAAGGGTTEVVEADAEPPTGKPAGEPKPEERFFADEIDVKVGPLGAAEVREGVRYLRFLPSKATPVVTFVGFGESSDEAVFAISRRVVELSGEGSCAPKKQLPCEFLTMTAGEAAMIKFGKQPRTFRLKLIDTRTVEIDRPRGGG